MMLGVVAEKREISGLRALERLLMRIYICDKIMAWRLCGATIDGSAERSDRCSDRRRRFGAPPVSPPLPGCRSRCWGPLPVPHSVAVAAAEVIGARRRAPGVAVAVIPRFDGAQAASPLASHSPILRRVRATRCTAQTITPIG